MPPLFPNRIEDGFGTRYAFFAAAGPSVHDCAIIGQRFSPELGFRWNASESWLLRVRPTGHAERPHTVHVVLGGKPWLTRVWMSPQGRFWASSIEHKLYEELPDGGYTTHDLPTQVTGVWGLHDRCVYAWSEGDERLFRWDGARWSDVPCPGQVLVMAGTKPDDLVAAGYDGAVWRWDGQAWTETAIALRGSVAGLCLAKADLAYAASLGGDLAEITPYGSQRRVKWNGPLLDVAAFGDEVLLATGESGLRRLAGATNQIEVVDALPAKRFDNQAGVLLITTNQGVVETRDGKTFGDALSAEVLRDLRGAQPPMF